MSTDSQVLIYIICVGSICGVWFIAYVVYPRWSEWYSNNLGERLTKRMEWLDRRDEMMEQKTIRRKKRHKEQAEARRAQVAAGLLAPDPKDAGDAAMEKEWGNVDGTGASEEKKEPVDEWDFSHIDPQEMMRKHCAQVRCFRASYTPLTPIACLSYATTHLYT